jgi:hypothetical protein
MNPARATSLERTIARLLSAMQSDGGRSKRLERELEDALAEGYARALELEGERRRARADLRALAAGDVEPTGGDDLAGLVRREQELSERETKLREILGDAREQLARRTSPRS